MSVEQKAGQVLMPFFQGRDYSRQLDTIRALHLAGSIVMTDNVPLAADGSVDTAAVGAMAAAFDHAARADGRGWPGLVGVDMEGGVVARLRAPLSEWPAPMSYGAAGSVPLASDAGAALGAELAGLGFTIDFAPDADVTIGPQDPTIGSRSMSGDPDAVGRLSTAFGQGLLDSGVLPVSKHFPGHGSVTADSHASLPVQNASVAELQARDWKPFQQAVAAGLPMIMMGHIAVPALEPGVPASVSTAGYAALRGLGFAGVAVTDAMNMAAIEEQYTDDAAAAVALAAGADLVLMPGDVVRAHAGIVAAVGSGALPAARLDEAARRVATMMLWRARVDPKPAGSAPGAGAAVSRAVSAAAVTVLDGPCSGPLIGSSVSLAGGSVLDRARFTAAAGRAGVGVGGGPLVVLAGYGSGPVSGQIAVSLDAPWPLAGSSAPSKIALYGNSPAAFDALLAVLTGQATAPGKLPAAVGPYPPGKGCP
ncbi:beta-N-acetylhexosaminidase [Arthrobacter sp. CJ23]|nr:beta-N-acetylhexosaminidase [Arthrobacter sp. CJ23]